MLNVAVEALFEALGIELKYCVNFYLEATIRLDAKFSVFFILVDIFISPLRMFVYVKYLVLEWARITEIITMP